MKYHLEVLNDKEFEDLCKDLLDVYYTVDFQIFKAGKDGGIDLLHSGKTENEIVVQCKHYVNSNYKLLSDALRTTELNNIRKMVPSPKRYVVATSLALSSGQTKEIKSILSPYIKNTNDIFGRKRIENLLSKNQAIEKRFFKLWLTSTNVLLNILHNAASYNSEFHREKILNRAKIYVPTQDFNQALDKLAQNKFLIISGAPGVGKTTLAYMLICERLAEGFELIYCDGKITEVEPMLSEDPSNKQIFFIDDFLGANLHDIINPKNPENKLISFIQKFQSSKNKYLVLTSRTTVLNQAIFNYEHLRFSGLATTSKYELLISQYSLLDKARILYNHLYFGDIGEIFLKSFYDKKNYSTIIKHRNYFPRLIQFITDENKFYESGFATVEEFIDDKLEHPEIIWAHAFEKQLEDEERYLLFCLFSLGGTNVSESHLSSAFELRYRYEIKHNNIRRKTKAYQNSLKKVLDGFVNSFRDTDTDSNVFSFFNPSITDFLLQYLRDNKIEIASILNSLAYIEQLTIYFDVNESKKIQIDESLKKEILLNLSANLENIGTIKTNASASLQKLQVIQSYFEDDFIVQQDVPIKLLTEIMSDWSNADSEGLAYLISKIARHEEWSDVILFISNSFIEIVNIILSNTKDEEDLEHLVEIFELYGHDFGVFIEDIDNKWLVQEKLGLVFSGMVADMSHDEQSIIEAIHEDGEDRAKSKISDKVWESYIEFTDRLSLNDYFDNLDHEYELDEDEIIENIKQNYSFDDDDYVAPRIIDEKPEIIKDPWIEIDRLFSRS